MYDTLYYESNVGVGAALTPLELFTRDLNIFGILFINVTKILIVKAIKRKPFI